MGNLTQAKEIIGIPNSTLVKTALNATGTAPIYACRAWVNFNGTGTVAIRASGNVSSITDNGVYDYITVDGVVVVKTGTDNSSSTISITQMVAIVPNGSTYSVTALKPFKYWGELRQ